MYTHLRGNRTNLFGFSCSSGSSASSDFAAGASGEVFTISVIGFDMSLTAVVGLTTESCGVEGEFSLFSDVKIGCFTGDSILRFSRFEAA